MKFQREKINLTGYRVTGKYSIEKILAGLLDFDFINTDIAIEKKQGESVAEMVGRRDWELFRRKEKNILLELARRNNIIIATGDKSVMYENVWETSQKNTLSVWLTADIKTICQRLSADSDTDNQRPLLTGIGTMDEISMVLSERQPFYEKSSDLTINTEGKTPEKVAEVISAEFKKGN